MVNMLTYHLKLFNDTTSYITLHAIKQNLNRNMDISISLILKSKVFAFKPMLRIYIYIYRLYYEIPEFNLICRPRCDDYMFCAVFIILHMVIIYIYIYIGTITFKSILRSKYHILILSHLRRIINTKPLSH